MTRSHPLISSQALHAQLSAEGSAVRVVDASWHLPTSQRDAYAEYQQTHIPGSVFFDIDAVSDPDSELPHMLPSAEEFSTAIANLGVGAEHSVVVYDSVGLFSAARVWWMFKVFGHQKVQVLDGGLPGWLAIDGATESGISQFSLPVNPMNAVLNTAAVCDCADVMKSIELGDACILDARPQARFDAAVPEPRKGLRSGHMPGAKSLPYTDLLTSSEEGVMHLKSAAALNEVFTSRGVNSDDPVITTCGSGVTAAVITLALEIAEIPAGRLYDGSWTEWGGRADTPIQ